METDGLTERAIVSQTCGEKLEGIDDEMERYLDNVAMDFCPECGKAVMQNARGQAQEVLL